jgi:superfamily II DNA/RNA helicase
MQTYTRDDLASMYLDQLEFEPYPVQEDALLAWFATKQGVLICAPTGTGKTLIAEAALFEALHTGKVAYYTTPLIALTEQKFQEVQAAAIRWGFQAEDVGLVTGNRKVNPDAKVLVVVAEILLNRLLNSVGHDFSNVAAVVMDEFHSFNDRERGIVWELSLSMLPKHVRMMLLSATVGNTADFMIWLNKSHGRRLDLVQSTDRKVPLRYHWIEDQLLNEQLEFMASGDDETRKTPTLLFSFNREECWRVAEQLKGKSLLSDGQQKQLVEELKRHNWSQGIGPKLKTILMRGVGVHHAGVLPKYKRIIESLFQRKLLTVCVCTETLSAGMNLPARSVLMTALLKGPPGRKTLLDPSVAHQIFGRAGRPQFDTEGHVFALAHEDDVKILRYKQKMDQIPEDTKDPILIKKRKKMKKKMPTRRTTEQYWGEAQFQKLIDAPPTNLQSQGSMPWRLLAYLLSISPDVSRLGDAIRKRLMDDKQVKRALIELGKMLITLEKAGYVRLDPPRPFAEDETGNTEPQVSVVDDVARRAEAGEFDFVEPSSEQPSDSTDETSDESRSDSNDAFGSGVGDSSSEDPSDASVSVEDVTTEQPQDEDSEDKSKSEDKDSDPLIPLPDSPAKKVKKDKPSSEPVKLTSSLKILLEAQGVSVDGKSDVPGQTRLVQPDEEEAYEPDRAYPSESLLDLLTFKSVNAIYGMFLVKVLPHCDAAERIQALESVLAFPGALSRNLRIPRPDMMPPSRFAAGYLNTELLKRGIVSAAELGMVQPKEQDDRFDEEEWVRPLNFPEKMLRLFRSEYPGVSEIPMTDVWAAGELLTFEGDFNKLITSRKLAKQEGIVFRHILRFILLCEEFLPHVEKDSDWHNELIDISEKLTEACREVDAHITDTMIESARAADPLLAETDSKP